MAHLNRIELIGYLGGDPELKYMQSGDAVMGFSLAVSERWKDKGGADRERTTWFRCAIFGKHAEALVRFVRKGAHVYVSGAMRSKEVEKDGVKRVHWDVRVEDFLLLDRKPQESPSPGRVSESSNLGDDDIPF